MAIYHFENNLLTEFQKTNFTSEGIKERQHLQSALKEQVEIIASDCLVIAEEFSEWSESQRRIDLLAIDKQANIVVIELKRTDTGEFMELQAIRYASMVSTLTFQKATEIYQKYLNLKDSSEDAETLLLDFLGWDEAKAENFASDVRIILVSANFSKELTTSVMWLNERDLDIRCVRLIPYKFEDKIFVDVQQIIPLPEAESYQIKIKQQSEERREARKSSKDYTRYLFNNQEFNKRKLVLAVIKKWIAENSPQSLEELLIAFPQSLHRGNLFVTRIEAEEISRRQDGKRRYFLEDDEIICFSDSSNYAVSNQWNKDSVGAFIEHSRNLGFEFEAVSE
ncbi:MAG: hypothetical protein H0U87_09675 [Acidobacteria bacterium]|jgi:hypothetical protein|nr:hypothetical protein [Acidobacteriota bacterium]